MPIIFKKIKFENQNLKFAKNSELFQYAISQPKTFVAISSNANTGKSTEFKWSLLAIAKYFKKGIDILFRFDKEIKEKFNDAKFLTLPSGLKNEKVNYKNEIEKILNEAEKMKPVFKKGFYFDENGEKINYEYETFFPKYDFFIKELTKLKNWQCEIAKNLKIKGTELFFEKEKIGEAFELNISNQKKSTENDTESAIILFDEIVPENGAYCPNEIDKFCRLLITRARVRDYKIFGIYNRSGNENNLYEFEFMENSEAVFVGATLPAFNLQNGGKPTGVQVFLNQTRWGKKDIQNSPNKPWFIFKGKQENLKNEELVFSFDMEKLKIGVVEKFDKIILCEIDKNENEHYERNNFKIVTKLLQKSLNSGCLYFQNEQIAYYFFENLGNY